MNISLIVKDLHRFETLNKDSKKAQNIIDRYYNSNYSELRQAYKSYSREKEKAFNSIKDRMHKEDATGLRILGANSSFLVVHIC